MKITLKERLYQYLLKGHGWVASGDLQRLVMQRTKYTARTAVRRLEELVVEGRLEVQYRKGHAYYRPSQKLTMQEWWDQIPGGGPKTGEVEFVEVDGQRVARIG